MEWAWAGPTSMCGLRGTLGTPEVSFTNSISADFCNQKLWELIFLALEPWAGGPVWVWDSSFLRDSSGIFIHMGGCQHVRVCTPPASLDGCGFFNSVLVRLPFNWISDVPE